MYGSPKALAMRGIPINRDRCGALDAKNKQAHSCPQELPIRLYGDPLPVILVQLPSIFEPAGDAELTEIIGRSNH